MRSARTVLSELKTDKYNDYLQKIYIDKDLVEYNRRRYIKAIEKFTEIYGEKEIEIYSAPGRSEVCGNHTDHQMGCALATAINLDVIAIVSKSEDMKIILSSDEYSKIEVDLCQLEMNPMELETTEALIRGIANGFMRNGYAYGGFFAYVCSDVLIGAGMSSSAAFESLIGTIFSEIYNQGKVSSVIIAQIGKYAENIYFGKPCGLMDQLACCVGGMIYIDFSKDEDDMIEKLEGDLNAYGYSLCLVDTKGSHADLTEDYAAIPREMQQVANCFNKNNLRAVSKKAVMENIPMLRNKVGDRAILRAIHFFDEEERVIRGKEAFMSKNFSTFLSCIKESGNSSVKLLQNIYSPQNIVSQEIMLGLTISELYMGSEGVCRVHGGGFAGTVQAFVHNSSVHIYKENIEKIFGKGSCYILKIRPYGGIKLTI